MSPGPQRGTPAGDASLAIRALARRTGGDVQELQTLYVLQALLARIAESAYREDFVLKGGVLLAAFAVRRPTRDIDLQATRMAGDVDAVVDRVRAVAAIRRPDGVAFDESSIVGSVIREIDEYPGVRVRLVGALGRARVTIGVDVSFGDPIWPQPQLVELPGVIPLESLRPVTMLGYPLTMVLAEKIITAIDRGEANTRWRDFADIYVLARVHHVDAAQLRASLQAVAGYRRVQLAPLLPRLASMPGRAQPKWWSWRARLHWDRDLPEQFADLLTVLAGFADPVLTGTVEGRWDPVASAWVPGGGSTDWQPGRRTRAPARLQGHNRHQSDGPRQDTPADRRRGC